MKNNKNIDRVFQENLKDFEVLPPQKMWNAIEKKITPVSKKRRVPFWLKISSIAAILVLFFSIGTIYFIPQNNFTKNFIPKRINKQKEERKTNTLRKVADSPKLIASEKKTSISISSKITNKKNEIILNSESEEITSSTVLNASTFHNEESPNQFQLKDAINLPPSKTKNAQVSKDFFTSGKLTVATIFAPIYINSFGDGSGINGEFKDSPISGNSSYSYGVKLAYQLNNKFSVQSGINLINLGYTTNNIYVTPGVAVIGLSNLSTNPILAKSEGSFDAKNSSSFDSNKGSLNQVFGYIEIPVEIKYNVTDGKVGLNLVGGFSTLLLNKDELFVETNNFTQSLGASNNLRSINFSGNIGVDIDYSLKKNLFINISPMFKVQTNTFSKNSGSVQPYYLGVYTGLNYKF